MRWVWCFNEPGGGGGVRMWGVGLCAGVVWSVHALYSSLWCFNELGRVS